MGIRHDLQLGRGCFFAGVRRRTIKPAPSRIEALAPGRVVEWQHGIQPAFLAPFGVLSPDPSGADNLKRIIPPDGLTLGSMPGNIKSLEAPRRAAPWLLPLSSAGSPLS
jgi:hypothetical protein